MGLGMAVAAAPRVDVDAARDDHVALTVADVDEALVVQVGHVADLSASERTRDAARRDRASGTALAAQSDRSERRRRTRDDPGRGRQHGFPGCL
jgi:hypothetical protein